MVPNLNNLKRKFDFRNLWQGLTVFIFLFLFFSSNTIFSQVTITKPSLTIPVCYGYPSTYNTLGNIVITETANNNFSIGTNITLILTTPSNFEFQTGIGSVSYILSKNISAASINVTTTTITVTYTVGAINKTDAMTISGIKIKAINLDSSGYITRTGGSGTINGLIPTTQVSAQITSTSGTPPTTAIAGANQVLGTCVTSTTLAGNLPSSGTGSWSIVSGGGTINTPSSPISTITELTPGVNTTLRWTISTSVCGSSYDDVTINTTIGPNCLLFCSAGGNLSSSVNYIRQVIINTNGDIDEPPYDTNSLTPNNFFTGWDYPYKHYLNTSATLVPSNIYFIMIKGVNGDVPDAKGNRTVRKIAAWIDWNQDGTFDNNAPVSDTSSPANEKLVEQTNAGSMILPSTYFKVPADAVVGTLRMRVLFTYDSPPDTNNGTGSGIPPNPCDTSSQTQVKDFNIIISGKIWTGATSTDWNTASNWSPNIVPTSSDYVYIPNTTNKPIISGTNYIGYASGLTIATGSSLTIEANNTLSVTNSITVNTGGTLDIKNNGSLVQSNNSAVNTGSAKITRTTRSMTVNDYVYWGSPITEDVFNQIPISFDLKYKWTSGTASGNWTAITSAPLQTPGEGFITRVATAGAIPFTFIGTPKNGVVNVTVNNYDSVATNQGNYVLMANPYPSAINATTFLTSNSTYLGGTIYFWTSKTTYTGGNYTSADYASWNSTGGTGTSPIALVPSNYIASCQGFFALSKTDGNITFNNSMRVSNNNSQFFKSTEPTNRIWLNLYNESNFRQTLFGYIDGATNDYDDMYDGYALTNNSINIYSLLNNIPLAIQGKALPFNENDKVLLGYKVTDSGNYSIGINSMDGIFAGNQNVYLRDKLLSIDHDLKIGSYDFISDAGTFDGRFEIVYISNSLGIRNETVTETAAMLLNNQIRIDSNQFIKSIYLYDISGKRIGSYSLGEPQKQFIDNFAYPSGIYIAEILLDNGITVKKKLIH